MRGSVVPLNSQKTGNILASVWVCGVGGDICFCVKNPILVLRCLNRVSSVLISTKSNDVNVMRNVVYVVRRTD